MTALAYFPIVATITCQCCKWALDADDFHPEHFHADFAQTIEALHGGPVCTGCMDSYTRCSVTGDVILRDEAFIGDDGDTYASRDVYDEAMINADDDADLIRLCAGWR